MSLRTSETDPLRINALKVANGELGLTICPGKQGESVFGAPWARDLHADIAAIRDWGADAVVTLVERPEMACLGVEALPQAVRAAGMDWHHLPIHDLEAPDAAFEAAWRQCGPCLHRLLENGGKVLVHCRGGRGRAGTLAALVLIERGLRPDAAIAAVRAVRHGAIETQAQERWLEGRVAAFRVQGHRIHASLLAGAMGDSLGAEIEFMSLQEIRRLFPEGLQTLPPHQGRAGAITDDTQMTLFTAEGLMAADASRDDEAIVRAVHEALVRWYHTQTSEAAGQADGAGLAADPRLHVCRAPGRTCLQALAMSGRPGLAAANASKGCGTIMRMAPVGLFLPRARVERLAMQTSALTHGHVTGQLAAAAWAGMLADVLAGDDLETAARKALGFCRSHQGGEETAAAISAALEAPRDGRPETVEGLGGGWIAEEALAIALYAALTADNLEQGLQIAVMHGGDSDSTGAIAGNMLGLLYPDEVSTHPWTAQVECADLVFHLARQGCELRAGLA